MTSAGVTTASAPPRSLETRIMLRALGFGPVHDRASALLSTATSGLSTLARQAGASQPDEHQAA